MYYIHIQVYTCIIYTYKYYVHILYTYTNIMYMYYIHVLYTYTSIIYSRKQKKVHVLSSFYDRSTKRSVL